MFVKPPETIFFGLSIPEALGQFFDMHLEQNVITDLLSKN
jgi:hypothetical protein